LNPFTNTYDMKINRTQLKNALAVVSPVAKAKSTAPATSWVRVTDTFMACAGLEAAIKVKIDAIGDTFPNDFYVSFFDLETIANKGNAEEIELNCADVLYFKSGRGKGQVPLQDGNSALSFDYELAEPLFSEPVRDLVSHLSLAGRFAGNDDLRPQMSQVNLQLKKDKVYCYSTNAYSVYLSDVKDIGYEEATDGKIVSITPRYIPIIAGMSGLVNVGNHTKAGWQQFNDDSISLFVRTADNPMRLETIESVVIKDYATECDIDLVEFFGAVERCLSFSNRATSLIKIGKGKMAAEDIDFGKNYDEELPGLLESAEVGLNGKQLLQAVGMNGTARLGFEAPNRVVGITKDNVRLYFMPVLI